MKKTGHGREKRLGTAGIALGVFWVLIGLVLALIGGGLWIEAKALEAESRGRSEEFDPQAVRGLENSWKTMELQALSYEFAQDFKGTYHYYIGFTEYGEVRVIRMRGELAPELEPYVEYLFSEEDEEAPMPLEIRGVAAVMDEDVREFAIEEINYMFGYDAVTEENADSVIGSCYLDLAGKPSGGGDLEGGRICLGLGVFFMACGIAVVVFSIRKRNRALAAEERERQSLREAWSYRNPEAGPEEEDGGLPAPLAGEGEPEKSTEETPSVKGNPVLGVLGAVGGALLGVLLWVLIGYVGFIAGLAGFAILKFALVGYQKLSGGLDKKGALFCLALAALMILFANVLDFILVFCQAFFEYEASMDTVRYVAANFAELMSTGEMWPDFVKNLIVGYGLSIWSSHKLIRAILTYKDGK